MSDTKFTPGPWTAIIHPDQVPKHSYEIACLPHKNIDAIDIVIDGKRDGWGTLEQMEANAALIAAAPDLYEALAAIVDHETNKRDFFTWGKKVDAAYDALKKARGET